MTKARKGPTNVGRPLLKRRQKKERRIQIRVNADQYEELCRRRGISRRGLSTFVRDAALGCTIKAPPSLANREAYQALGKVGNNLNQAVKALHEGRSKAIDARIIHELYEEVRRLRLALMGYSK